MVVVVLFPQCAMLGVVMSGFRFLVLCCGAGGGGGWGGGESGLMLNIAEPQIYCSFETHGHWPVRWGQQQIWRNLRTILDFSQKANCLLGHIFSQKKYLISAKIRDASDFRTTLLACHYSHTVLN